jgi:hypothetical protein
VGNILNSFAAARLCKDGYDADGNAKAAGLSLHQFRALCCLRLGKLAQHNIKKTTIINLTYKPNKMIMKKSNIFLSPKNKKND